MEGIYDGAAIDSCYRCALVAPDEEPCPLCHGRMRYQPATMMDSVTLGEAVGRAVDAHLDAGTAASLIELLELLHRFDSEAVTELERDGRLDLADLRAAYRRLGLP